MAEPTRALSGPAGVGFVLGAAAGLWLGLFADVLINGVPLFRFTAGAFGLVGGVLGAVAARRTWWRKRRVWVAAAALWLLTGYLLSLGPVTYVGVRGWLPAAWRPTLSVVYGPLRSLERSYGALAEYVDWCHDLAWTHRRAASRR